MLFYLVLIVLLLIIYLPTRKNNYWKNKNVPHSKPKYLFGNYADMLLLRKSWPETVQDICKEFPNEKYIGAFFGTEPVFIPVDPEILKLVLVKDFYYFQGRDIIQHDPKQPGRLNIFSTFGDNWKVLRKNLTPLFSSAKMRNMFHLIEKCSFCFEKLLDYETSVSQEIEIKLLTDRLMVDVIGACAFGVDANTMGAEGKHNIFAKMAYHITNLPRRSAIERMLNTIWPSLFFFIRSSVVNKSLPFLLDVLKAVMSERQNKPSGINDFVDLVLCWKLQNYMNGDSIECMKTGEENKVKIEVSDNLLAAQCFVFFTAGFETSSATLTFTLYELAKHEDIQNKVLEEVDSYLLRNGNKLKYEVVTELPYTQAVFDEALRMYPVIGVITRMVSGNYTLPNGVCLEKGLRIHLPVQQLHYDPKNFPNPEVFRPERFFGDEKRNIKPYTYMPFGEGLRACIGVRFAKMQIFAGLVTVLKKYRVELADGTPANMKFRTYSIITTPDKPIKLKFVERDGWQTRVFV